MAFRDDCRCIVPPHPKLEAQIARTLQGVRQGHAAPAEKTDEYLDQLTFELITNRPAKTRAHTLSSPTKDFAPVVGTKKAIVLLVDFSDAPATTSQSHYQDMLFSSGTYAGGSMRDYYREASYNKLTVTGNVAGAGGPTSGWFRAPHPKSYYADGNFGFNGYPKNAQKLVEDVLDLANPFVNFSQYDNDGDGNIEALVIICAGSGGEVTGNKNDIWSHKWGISPKTLDGKKASTYFMAPEDGRVGVMAHELGHLLMGWPDLYDTDYSSAGTGRWDLMAGGSWNNGGNTPAHPTAWCKYKVGWITPTVLFNNGQTVTFNPYADQGHVYKLPIGSASSKEYFLVSNRQKKKFDAHLPGEGLIIEHVDDNLSNNTDENHYLVDIEQADGQRDLNTNANRGDANDPYPTASNDKFTKDTTPNSKAYSGADSKVAVTDIKKLAGDKVSAKMSVGGVAAKVWHYNVIPRYTYAGNVSQLAYVYLDGLGWRRIRHGSSDGVTNMFIMCCEAVANGKKLHAYADGSYVYNLYLV